MSNEEKAEVAKLLGMSEKEVAKLSPESLEKRKELAELQKSIDEDNATRSGVGTRLYSGLTRGKGSLIIKYEQFDEAKPELCPKSIAQFMEVTGVKDEPGLVERLVKGHNEILYTTASDPLAEYVEDSWPDDAQTQFRLVVRNYSRGTGTALEDAVALIKPGFIKQFSASPTK